MIPVEEVPYDDETALRDWMYKLYEEKDKLLDYYYKHGTFHEGEKGKRIKFRWSRIIGQYAFWFTSFVIQVKIYHFLLAGLYRFFFPYV